MDPARKQGPCQLGSLCVSASKRLQARETAATSPSRHGYQRAQAVHLLPEMSGSPEGKLRQLKQSQRQRAAQTSHSPARQAKSRTCAHVCACVTGTNPCSVGVHARIPRAGVSGRAHTHLPRPGGAGRICFHWQRGHLPRGHKGGRTGVPSARARAGDAETSAQGLIYQRDRSRCQSLPQKSAGLKMQRTETLRHSCLAWSPSGKPKRPPLALGGPTVAPDRAELGGAQRDTLLEAGRGEQGGGEKTQQGGALTQRSKTAWCLCSDVEAIGGGPGDSELSQPMGSRVPPHPRSGMGGAQLGNEQD